MVAHTITTARQSGLFDRIVVSTDDPEIQRIAEAHGAECPFLRPSHLSDDHTPTAPVIQHALTWLANHGTNARHACCIYATAPFVTIGDLRQSLNLLQSQAAGSAFSITSFPFPIFRALKMQEDGTVSMFWPENELVRSQDLPEAYHDAGQFYWLDVGRFMREPKIYFADSVGFCLPRFRVQDIDTQEDWERAELMYTLLKTQGHL